LLKGDATLQSLVQFWQIRWVRHGVVPVIFFTLATLLLTYPVITQLSTHAAGAPYGDAFEVVRMIWWTGESLAQGMHPASQPMLTYPDQFFSAMHWASPLTHLAAWPLTWFFSSLTAYNLSFLLTHILTGLAAYLLLWELTRHSGAALLGGLILIAFPTRMAHATAGHLGLLVNYWRLLYVWSLVRLWKAPGWRWGVLAGLFLVLTAATFPTNIVYELVPLSAVLILWWGWEHRAEWRQWGRPLLLVGVIAAVGLLVLYWPLLQGLLSGSADYLQEGGVVQYSADLLGFITPNLYNPTAVRLGLIPSWAGEVLGDNINEGTAYLGIAAVALAVLGLIWRGRQARPWLVLALVCMVLSLGPVLKIADQIVTLTPEPGRTESVLMPYALFGALPGMSMGRTPGRLNIITGMALAVLAAYGWAALSARLPRLKRSGWQIGAVLVVAALILIEYPVFAAFPTTEAAVPTYFDELAADAEQDIVRPVLNLPAGDFFVGEWLLYYQTIHHQPVLTGRVGRNTPADPALLALVNRAALPEETDGLLPELSINQRAAYLHATGADVVVVHRRFGEGEAMASFLPDVLGPAVYADEAVTIFEVSDASPLEDVIYTVGGGWTAGEDIWLADELTVSLYVPAVVNGALRYEASAWLYDRWMTVLVDDEPAAVNYLSSAEVDGWQTPALSLGAGYHQVRFTLPPEPDGCTRLPDEDACRRARILSLRWEDDDENQGQIVDFGDKMRLVNNAIQVDDASGRIELTTVWQAIGPERADYTMFAHLLNAAGESVGQWDGRLGGDVMPTGVWPVNGQVIQRAVIDYGAADVPPGDYELYIGLYTYPDIVRLPVDSPLPRARDGMLYLHSLSITPDSTSPGAAD
jgi:hypothetical protein